MIDRSCWFYFSGELWLIQGLKSVPTPRSQLQGQRAEGHYTDFQTFSLLSTQIPREIEDWEKKKPSKPLWKTNKKTPNQKSPKPPKNKQQKKTKKPKKAKETKENKPKTPQNTKLKPNPKPTKQKPQNFITKDLHDF